MFFQNVTRNRFTLAAACVLAASAAVASAAPVCDVQTYGAKGDGKTKDTVAIQKAIDDCASQGGGTVQLSAGTYLSAPIVLKSNINFHLDKGATLLGSSVKSDYPAKLEFREPGRQSLVSATGAENIAITGEGVIDGAGDIWWKEAHELHAKGIDAGVMGLDFTRPRLVVFDHCKHVLMQDVTVQNSPMWQIVPYYSDNLIFRNIKILAPEHSSNSDAIDPFSSSHIIIDHVLADVGDDNVAIKSGAIGSVGPDDSSHDIWITDCTFKHGHGLSIGSEISGGVQNVVAERITFEGTDNGIRVKANRDRGNADIGNFVFRDITMKNVKNDIIISEYYPKVAPKEGESSKPLSRLTPFFHDILIENVKAEGETNAGVIIGLPESLVQGVTLRNVQIKSKTPMIVGYAKVAAENFSVQASQGGEGISKIAGAEIVGK
jgi:polygalacturonase